MGGESSKTKDGGGSVNMFNEQERQKIQSLFYSVTENTRLGTQVQLEKYLKRWLPQTIIQRLCVSVVKLSNTQGNGFTLHGLSHLLSHLFKGTLTEKSSMVLSLSTDSGRVSAADLVEFVSSVADTYIQIVQKSKVAQTWKFCRQDGWVRKLSIYLLQERFMNSSEKAKYVVEPPENCTYDEADLEFWLSRCPLFIHMLDLVFHSCFQIDESEEFSSRFLTPMLPLATNVDWTKTQTILDVPAMLMLVHSLPGALHTQWRPLYSNRQHGDSFSQLQTRILKKGPTLLLIRDKEGHVFGGFASVSWEVRPQFMGTTSCFLFSLSPHFNVYTTSGYNDHYMYLNHGVQTMPNGLGMGGQLEFFGLWIDESFNIGHSKAGPLCTTYGSPQLSKSTNFEVDIIEVWGLGPEPKVEGPESDGRSILDKDEGAKALLAMAGKGPVSEGLREGDATADIPEEHELPPL